MTPEVFVELKANISEFSAKLNEARAEMTKTQEHGGSAFSALHGAAVAALAGVAVGAIAAAKEAVHLADAYEVSHARLVTALDDSGQSFDVWKGRISEAEKQGEKFGLTNAQIEDALSRLETMVHNPAVALKDLGVAEDLAAARGLDLNDAAKLVGKASEGTYTALVKLGVVTKDQAKDFHSGAEAVDFLGKAFAGQAAAQAETFGGKLKALKTEVEDAGKNFGLWLIPKLEAVAGFLAAGVGWLQEHAKQVRIAAAAVSVLLVPALIAWAAAQAAAIGATVIGQIQTYVVMLGNLAREMTAMGLAADIATGPLGMIAAGIAALMLKGDDLPGKVKDWGQAFVQNLGPGVDKVQALTAEEDRLGRALDAIKMDPHPTKAMWEEYGRLADKYQLVNGLLGKAKDAQAADSQAKLDAKKVQDELNAAEDKAPPILSKLTQAEKDAAEAAKTDKKEVNDLKTALDALLGVHLDAEKAMIAYNQSIEALKTGIVKSTTAVDDNTKVGQANLTLVIDAIEKAKAQADAYAKETGDVGGANKALFDHVQQLLAVAEKSGLTHAQVDKLRAMFDLQSTTLGITSQAVQALRDQYGAVPTRVATDIVATLNLDPTAAANAVAVLAARVAAFQNQLRVVSQGLTPTGGAFAAGGITSGPTFLAGEGNPAHPEYVIPTDPMYRANAVDLFKKLGKDLHLYAAGGIVGDQAGAAGSAVGLEMLIRRGLMQQSLAASAGIADNINAAVGPLLASLSAPFSGGGGVARWAGVATQVANMLGQPGSVGAILRRIQFESGGDPFSVNRSDINFLMGFPSVGLAQVIGPTFAAYAGQFRNVGPFAYGVSENPLANVYAGMNYATNRYGSIAAVDPRVMPSGYDQGGWLMPGVTMAYNGTGRPERVLPPGGGGVVVNLNVGTVIGIGGAQQLAEIVRAEVIKGNRGRTSSGL